MNNGIIEVQPAQEKKEAEAAKQKAIEAKQKAQEAAARSSRATKKMAVPVEVDIETGEFKQATQPGMFDQEQEEEKR